MGQGKGYPGKLYRDASLLEEVCFLLSTENDLGLRHRSMAFSGELLSVLSISPHEMKAVYP